MATQKLTVSEAAERLGVTTRQVTNLLAAGMPHAGEGNRRRILWPAARKWRDEQLREEGKRSVKPRTLDEARLRRETADAELKELELAQRRGELMTVEQFDRALGDAFARARSKLLNLPTAVAMRVVGETLQARTQEAQVLVDEVLTELARGEDVPEEEAA